MSSPDPRDNIQPAPLSDGLTGPGEQNSPDLPRSFLGLPEYPSDLNAPVPSYLKKSLIVETTAGAILGCLVGGIIGALTEEVRDFLIGVPVGLVVGAGVGALVGKITGPTGELTTKTLLRAMVRGTLVVLFGALAAAVGIVPIPKERESD